MTAWEWEDLAFFFNSNMLLVSNEGPLLAPIDRFSIIRDAEGELLLVTVSRGHFRESLPEIAAGTVKTANEAVTFESRPDFNLSYQAVARGVVPYKYSEKYEKSGLIETTQISSIRSMEGVYQKDIAVAYVIEWIKNIDRGWSIWTGASVTTIETISNTRTLKAGDNIIELVANKTSYSGSNFGLRIFIGAWELYICATSCEKNNEGDDRSGFILYPGDISESEREKIRDVLSFCLGTYLSCIGFIALSEACEPVFVKALSAERIGVTAARIPALPPAPLWLRYSNEIHQEVLGPMANAIFAKYDELSFADLSWAYWHAACAPVHMAAAHYGAALEALRRACTEARTPKATLVQNTEWIELKQKLLTCISQAGLDPEVENVFMNKISNFNQLPQDKALEDVLASMGLSVGALERKAWKRRNQAAHGSSFAKREFTTTIRETKLLRILIHRMVLASTNASDRYYDYYSLNFPIRNLNDPIPST